MSFQEGSHPERQQRWIKTPASDCMPSWCSNEDAIQACGAFQNELISLKHTPIEQGSGSDEVYTVFPKHSQRNTPKGACWSNHWPQKRSFVSQISAIQIFESQRFVIQTFVIGTFLCIPLDTLVTRVPCRTVLTMDLHQSSWHCTLARLHAPPARPLPRPTQRESGLPEPHKPIVTVHGQQGIATQGATNRSSVFYTEEGEPRLRLAALPTAAPPRRTRSGLRGVVRRSRVTLHETL